MHLKLRYFDTKNYRIVIRNGRWICIKEGKK